MIYVLSGGVGFNFDVVGGTSAPANPKENTIWVNTSTTISSWGFIASKPTWSSHEGAVYFASEMSSNNKDRDFNALKRNSIWINPISVWQYVSGAWVDKTAKIYQGGKWVDWWNGELYITGNEYTSTTGGWQTRAWMLRSGYVATAPTLTKNGSSMTAVFSTKNGSGVIEIANDVNLSSYSTLNLEYTGTGLNNDYYFMLGVADRNAAYYKDNAIAIMEVVYNDAKTAAKTVSLDISGVNKAVNVYLGMHITSSSSGTNTLNIHRVWLE